MEERKYCTCSTVGPRGGIRRRHADGCPVKGLKQPCPKCGAMEYTGVGPTNADHCRHCAKWEQSLRWSTSDYGSWRWWDRWHSLS